MTTRLLLAPQFKHLRSPMEEPLSAGDDSKNPPVENEEIQPPDFYAMNIIYQMRIYDMLTVIARAVNEEEANNLVKLHSQGEVVGPPPVYVPNEE